MISHLKFFHKAFSNNKIWTLNKLGKWNDFSILQFYKITFKYFYSRWERLTLALTSGVMTENKELINIYPMLFLHVTLQITICCYLNKHRLETGRNQKVIKHSTSVNVKCYFLRPCDPFVTNIYIFQDRVNYCLLTLYRRTKRV